MLNIIWSAFFICSIISGLYLSLFAGSPQIWTEISQTLFSAAADAFTLCLNLTGMLCFWLGFLNIAEKSGLTSWLSKILRPLMQKIFPEVPSDHPALGSVLMNISANMLGLDNAATPMGLKAMEQLQEINPHKDSASNAQILFTVLNASAVTIIPISILMYRQMLGSINPGAVFIPILLATSVSTLTGFLSVAFIQKLKILNITVFLYLLIFITLISGIAFGFAHLPAEARLKYSDSLGNFILCMIIFLFLIAGLVRKLNLYETFIEGAKQGFETAVRIVPYLVAMLTAIAVFRASHLMDGLFDLIVRFCSYFSLNTDFVPALPTAFMKPLSGSGARAMMIETMQTYGVDSFEGFTASVCQGSTETTFYVLAVYFGAVKITKTRSALGCALLADLAGLIAAIYFSYVFYVKV